MRTTCLAKRGQSIVEVCIEIELPPDDHRFSPHGVLISPFQSAYFVPRLNMVDTPTRSSQYDLDAKTCFPSLLALVVVVFAYL